MSQMESCTIDPIATHDLRVCLRPPIPEIAVAAGLLNDAVTAHLDGRFEVTENLLERANIRAIYEWANSLIGPFTKFNTPRFRSNPSSKGPISKEKARMPSAELKRMLHGRDGYHCRFCGTPVIRKQVRQRLALLYPDVTRCWAGKGNNHAAVAVMDAQYDHIVPHSRGGRNDLENLVLTCSPCNYGRVAFTLEEMGLFDPRTRKPVECVFPGWDGLERLLQ